MNIRKIKKEEFEKLKRLFPNNEDMWIKYKKKIIQELDKQEIDIFVIESNESIIGEITVNYVSHELETETIPNRRVYLEAFRVDKEYQGQGLGQKLINYCTEYLIKEGYTQFTIGVEDDNDIAKHIYFKLGFDNAIDKGHGNEFDPCEYTLYLKDIDKFELQKDIEELIKKENGITAIGTIELKNNDIMRKINNRYFMVFAWIEGKTLKAEEITEKYCEIIGETLAKIHNIDFSKIEDNERKKINIEQFDWNKYLELAKKENKDYLNSS